MTYCPECGTELKAGAKFCPECGTQIPEKKRKKGTPAVIPSARIPQPKVMPGEKRPMHYTAERVETSEQGIPASEVPKNRGGVTYPSSATTRYGGKTPEEQLKATSRRNNRIGAAIAVPVALAIFLGVTSAVLGYPIWEFPRGGGGGGGGGGGSASFDGTYAATVTTRTPIGTTNLSGTFTVSNGRVTGNWGTFTGTVDVNGNFTGTTIISQGSPQMAMRGIFSRTGNFTLSGSTSNSSQTVVAHKI